MIYIQAGKVFCWREKGLERLILYCFGMIDILVCVGGRGGGGFVGEYFSVEFVRGAIVRYCSAFIILH